MESAKLCAKLERFASPGTRPAVKGKACLLPGRQQWHVPVFALLIAFS